MSAYFLINILIVLFPFAFSFEKQIKFYKNWKYYLLSISVVSTGYIIWDIYAAMRGDWSFNPAHTLAVRIYGLPLEEILFFVTVPYSSIFVYETICFYLKDKQLSISSYFVFGSAAILTGTAFYYVDQYYTFTVLLFCAGFLVLAEIKMKGLLRSRNYWIVVSLTYVPFFIVNYFLTSIPIVSYSDSAIWGTRVTTIPVEDFFYSFSMISFWLYFYNYFKKNF